MGAVRLGIQTAEKNIAISTSNPHDSSPAISILAKLAISKKLYVCNKQIQYYGFFNFKPLHPAKKTWWAFFFFFFFLNIFFLQEQALLRII